MKTCRICRECTAIENMKDLTRNVCKGCKKSHILELGGGNEQHQERELRLLSGYTNVDRVPYDDKTVRWDFERLVGEDMHHFQTETVDHIYTSHCLEHIHNLKALLNECHRILRPNRFMEIVVPHADSDKAHAIDHCRVFTRETFRSLAYGDISDYGYRPWRIVYLEGEKDDANNPELRCIMTPVK